jgi:biopolymer transport protein TolR
MVDDERLADPPPRMRGSGVHSGRGHVPTSTAFGGSAMPHVAGVEGGAVTSDINVTPMIDVMLVLLIIFMVVTPLLAAYDATLPQAMHLVPEPQDDVITLGIDANGVFYVNADAVAPESLAPLLRQIYAGRPGDHLLYLRADRNIGYNVVLDGIDAARAAGVRTIGAITEQLTDDAQAAAGGEPPGRLAARQRGD